jgi:hypothetical protein
MAGRSLFERNGFEHCQSLGRFDLLHKPLRADALPPRFIDWTRRQPEYTGWHLLYADQCPWHTKSVADLQQACDARGIQLQVTRLDSPIDAQFGPSGYGTFALLHDGKLLADHYISRTRFENILKNELQKES